MKKLLTSIAAAALLVTCGCKSTPLNHALYVTTVSTGVALGVDRYPQAVPYLRVAAPLVCAAAQGTNVSPSEIVTLLQNSPAAQAVATPEGKLILNGSLVLYIALFEEYGGAVSQNPQLQTYLSWTCEAIQLGLPPGPSRARARLLPPHVL